jgi:DNA-binding HxlR family transcriptional regulator
MSQRPVIDPSSCSISATLDALGDEWSLLVLRELFFGVHRFNDIQNDLGISRSVLSARLNRLVDLGVVRTVPYQDPGDRVRHQYRLTRKGVALLPAMVSLMQWGDEYVNGGEGPYVLTDRTTGAKVRVELRTADGSPVEPNEIVVQSRYEARKRSRT